MKNPDHEQVRYAFKHAPQIVKDAFIDDAMLAAAGNLRTKYDLHVDVAGKINGFISHLLLGLTSPREFEEELRELGLDQRVAAAITQDINKTIFIPIHEKMRKEGVGTDMASAMARPTTPAPPYMPPMAPRVVPSPAPVAPPTPPPPPTSLPGATLPASQPRPYTPPPLPTRPVASSPLPPKTILPGTTINLDQPTPPGMPTINKLQGRVLPPPVYDPTTVRRTPPTQNQPAALPSARPYTADPYHEPVDEK